MPITNVPQASIYCPACGSKMRKVDGRYGPFYGCSSYPKCKKIVKTKDAWKYDKPPVQKDFTPSSYQVDIRDFALHPQGNLVVEARPGSGKTTTLVWVGNQLGKDFLGIAFNKHISETWSDKTSRGEIRTSCSFGLKTIRYNFTGVKVDSNGYKFRGLINPMLDAQRHLDNGQRKAVYHATRRLYDLSRSTLNRDYQFLADRYGIEINGDADLVYMLTDSCIKQGLKMTNFVDFGDMLSMPYYLKLAAPKYDAVLADEAQDFTNAEAELILSALSPDGFIICVGDRRQALYGFRGANVDSIPNLISRLSAKCLDLPISYRCPTSIIDLVKPIDPGIRAAPGAIEGEVLYQPQRDALRDTGPGDMILCRTNAPLVRPIYSLIQSGIKATIRGRDIGKGLVVLIEKFEGKVLDLNQLLYNMADYKDREVGKAIAAKKNSKAQSIQDKVDTVFALSEGCLSIKELKEKTVSIFDDARASVVGSTVHRAKGLEADRVVIIRPDLMPHPLAVKDWEVAQEQNVIFVACTRAKKTLVFAEGE